MNLKVNIIASSSKGNTIVVDDGVSKLLLDAGISYSKLSRKVKMSEVEAVLITHSHMDHYKAVPELIRRGVDVYMSQGTSEEKEAPPCQLASHLQQIETANWHILPFGVEHDVPCLGYLFESKNTAKKGVYIVDSSFIDYDFTGVTHWIIECNYDETILAGSSHEEWLKDRIRKSHFSLDGLKTFFSSSDLSHTEEIYLVHLSDSNSNEQQFIEQIEALTGVPVYT